MSLKKTLEHQLQIWFSTGRTRCIISVSHVPTEIRRFCFYKEHNLSNKEGMMIREIVTMAENKIIQSRTSEKVPIHNFTISKNLFEMLIREIQQKIDKI